MFFPRENPERVRHYDTLAHPGLVTVLGAAAFGGRWLELEKGAFPPSAGIGQKSCAVEFL